jgi:sulfoxide reductase heme-binding subunit YedZ
MDGLSQEPEMLEQQQTDAWPSKPLLFVLVASVIALLWAVGTSDSAKVAWFASRSAGITAYLLLGLSTITGLLTSSRILFKWVKPPELLELHKVLSFVGLAAIAVHGFVLMFDTYFSYNVWRISVPFLSEYRPVEVGIGVISGYLMLMVTLSFYVKKQIGGPKVWRMLHYASFPVFGLGTLHGITSGTDSSSPWVIGMYAAMVTIVLFLTYVRILGGRYIPTRRRRPETPVS